MIPVFRKQLISAEAFESAGVWDVDGDGDGRCELIPGKRHRAHCGNDPGELDARGIYAFKWTGEGFAKGVVDYVPPEGSGGGCGIQFALADLRGRGRCDFVAPGKDGLHVYWNEGLPVIG